MFLLSKYYFDRECSLDAQFVMSPPPPSNQLVTIFSPPPNDPSSGRTTPSSIGGASSGRASALTVGSTATSNISFDTQAPPNTTIRPIPRQGSFTVLDQDRVPRSLLVGRRVLPHTVLWSTWRYYPLCPKFPIRLIAARVPLSGIKCIRG